jgi:chromosome segregation ATPase
MATELDMVQAAKERAQRDLDDLREQRRAAEAELAAYRAKIAKAQQQAELVEGQCTKAIETAQRLRDEAIQAAERTAQSVADDVARLTAQRREEEAVLARQREQAQTALVTAQQDREKAIAEASRATAIGTAALRKLRECKQFIDEALGQ